MRSGAGTGRRLGRHTLRARNPRLVGRNAGSLAQLERKTQRSPAPGTRRVTIAPGLVLLERMYEPSLRRTGTSLVVLFPFANEGNLHLHAGGGFDDLAVLAIALVVALVVIVRSNRGGKKGPGNGEGRS